MELDKILIEELINKYHFIDSIALKNFVDEGDEIYRLSKTLFFRGYDHSPSDDLPNKPDFFYEKIKSKFIKKKLNDHENCDNMGSIFEKVRSKMIEHKNIEDPNCILVDDENEYYVVAEIDYPLNMSARVQFKCNTEITIGLLLYLHTVAYQLVYSIKNTDNIKDLVYNGSYDIIIYENVILCNFDSELK